MGSIRLIMIVLFMPILATAVEPSDEKLLAGFKKLLSQIQRKLGHDTFARIRAQALVEFERGEFEAFDPLVGDTSCQLRALACVASRDITAIDSDTQDWLVLTYLLGKALVVVRGDDGFNIHDQQGINSIEHLNSFLSNFSTELNKSAIADLKRAVAYFSVLFARRQARLIENATLRTHVEDLFNNQCMVNDGGGRPVLACVGICHLLLERARAQRFPIVLRLRLASGTRTRTLGTIRLVYMANERGVFGRINPRLLARHAPVVVVEGLIDIFNNRANAPSAEEIATYIDRLDFEYAMRIEHELHPQFAGPQGERPLVNTVENEIARRWLHTRERYDNAYLGRDERGRITRNDPRPFAIDHIFAATNAEIQRYNPFNGQTAALIQVDLQDAVYYRSPIVSLVERYGPSILALAVAMLNFANQGSIK